MRKSSVIVLVCGMALGGTGAMAAVDIKVNCATVDIYGNVTCNQFCEGCAESQCVMAGVKCESGTIGPITPDPITPTSCSIGQWLLTSGRVTSCRDCPRDTTNGGAPVTSDLGATDESDCYIPSGSSFSDGTGSGTFTGDCHYVSLSLSL